MTTQPTGASAADPGLVDEDSAGDASEAAKGEQQ